MASSLVVTPGKPVVALSVRQFRAQALNLASSCWVLDVGVCSASTLSWQTLMQVVILPWKRSSSREMAWSAWAIGLEHCSTQFCSCSCEPCWSQHFALHKYDCLRIERRNLVSKEANIASTLRCRLSSAWRRALAPVLLSIVVRGWVVQNFTSDGKWI